MRIRILFAATLVLVTALAIGPAGTPAAPGENAVVHWSGVAEGAIAAGRPPASSSVLAGIVHGAIYDAVAAVEGGLEPFATAVTAPSGASADAAVAQAARDVLVARVPGQAINVQIAYDAYMASIPNGPVEGRGQGRRIGRGSRHARAAGRGPLRRRRPVRSADAWAGCVRADRADDPRRRQARPRAAVHVRLAVRVPAPWPNRADEKALRRRPRRAAGVRTRDGQRPVARADRDGPLLHRTRPSCSTAAPCGGS